MAKSTLESLLESIRAGALFDVSTALQAETAEGIAMPDVWALAARHLDHQGFGDLAKAIWQKQYTAGNITAENVAALTQSNLDRGAQLVAAGIVQTFMDRLPEVETLASDLRVLLAKIMLESDVALAKRLIAGMDYLGSPEVALVLVDILRHGGELLQAQSLLLGELATYVEGDDRFQARLARTCESLGQWDQATLQWRVLWQKGDGVAALNLIRLHGKQEQVAEQRAVASQVMAQHPDPLVRIRAAIGLQAYDLLAHLVGTMFDRAELGTRWNAHETSQIQLLQQDLLAAGCLGMAIWVEQEAARQQPDAPVEKIATHLQQFATREVSQLLGPFAFHTKSRVYSWDVAAGIVQSGLAGLIEPYVRPVDGHPETILLVNATLGAGGAERQFLVMIKSLIAAGVARHRLHVALFSVSKDRGQAHFLPELVALGIAFTDLSLHSVLPVDADSPSFAPLLPVPLRNDVMKLRPLAKRLRPSVIHGWQDRAGMAAAWVGLELGCRRIVMSARNMQPAKRRATLPYARRLSQAFVGHPSVTLTVNSHMGVNDYVEWLDLEPSKVLPLLNGIDASTLVIQDRATTTAATQSLGVPNAAYALPQSQPVMRSGLPPLVLGGVFRFAQNKRPMLWLEILHLVRQKFQFPVRGILLGNGPLKQETKATAETLGLANVIEWRETQSDPRKIYRGMSALLLASRVEGTPNVLLEAQASGLAVASYDVGGSREAALCHDEQRVENDNLIFPQEFTAQQAADAIEQWWPRVCRGDPQARRDKVLNAYGTDALAKNVMRLYGIAEV